MSGCLKRDKSKSGIKGESAQAFPTKNDICLEKDYTDIRSLRSVKTKNDDVFVCGGGFYNTALIGALRNAMPARSFFSTEKVGYDPRFVEAAAFSWLAFMRINHLPVKLVTSKRMRRLQLGAIHS